MYPVSHRALTPCIHVQLVASYSNPVRNTACLGKTRTRKGRCEAIQAGSEEEHTEPGAGTLAVLGKCISIKAEAPIVLCPPFLPSSSSKCLSHSHTPPLPKSVWVLMPFTIKHHQPPGCSPPPPRCVFFWVTSPSLKTCFSSTSFKSPPSISVTLPDWSQHQVCPVHPLLCRPPSPAATIPCFLYLIPRDPVSSERLPPGLLLCCQ